MDEPKVTKDEVNDGMITALRHERAGYVQRAAGAADEATAAAMRRRIAQVEEQLALRGATPTEDAAAVEEQEPTDPPADPPVDPPKGATAAAKRGQQTRA